jgi:hypothetical protein
VRALSSPLRKLLETSVLSARRAGEGAARAAVEGLGVFADRRPEHLDANQATLRNGLRAKWRQFGSDRELLIAECAYEQWHRLLFARFLAENNLLLHPEYKAPVRLADCEELAAELGEPDAWSVAARFAAEILPGIFRIDDPCVRLRLAPEGRYALEQILDEIPAETFLADDALGWVYQFWQKDKKDEVNASERKVGGADLGPVTQLFTENYMVRFLLENSLGAWWAARHPDSPLVKDFDYLRFDDDGKPAAGTFDGWPDRVAAVTVMDPCCGSGHFLVQAFSMLWQMRAEEEDLSPVDAQDAALRDNLFGLELDPRCVQIAMFAVALQAWKAGGKWRQLPVPNVACSGIPVKAPVEEWKQLAHGDYRLENALIRLHILFREADTLGSLIDPKGAAELGDRIGLQQSFDNINWDEVAPLVEKALRAEAEDPATVVLGACAASVARAALLLSRNYSLLATNVPYLGRGKQSEALKNYIERHFPEGRADLAAAFAQRCMRFSEEDGTTAIVAPQNLLFLKSYDRLREHLLTKCCLNLVARLGSNAFRDMNWWAAITMLAVWSDRRPMDRGTFFGLDVGDNKDQEVKARLLTTRQLRSVHQRIQLKNLNHAVTFMDLESVGLMVDLVKSYEGMSTGDGDRYLLKHWELDHLRNRPQWEYFQVTPDATAQFAGCSEVVRWEEGRGTLSESSAARIQGLPVWGKQGVLISKMNQLKATRYFGAKFDKMAAVLLPRSENLLPAVWAFTSSTEYHSLVREVSQKVDVATATLVQVPFDVERWRRVALEQFPGGLPEPWSDDPTQWLFEGRPEVSTVPLQVAVARLVGYRWPEQAEQDDLDPLSDADGVVCLPSVAGEAPAPDRVQQLLAVAYGESWSPAKVKNLLEQVGSKKKNLSAWLRDEFFKQHCALFGNRPFVWHIWDGLNDGFSALVDYHRFDRKMLEKLAYTYLGQDWVERQRAELRDEVAGAEARLSAALALQQKLEAILTGEAPLDIYVRWKEPHEQPIGWEPDLNDGVRLNVRPFVEAGVLRAPFNINWRNDRGKNPDGSERENNRHLTLSQKDGARKRAGRP